MPPAAPTTPAATFATPSKTRPNGQVPLRDRQRRALAAICDTFVPGGDGLPSATDIGVPEALMAAVALNPRAAERKQFTQLLRLWDTALLTAAGGGGPRRFSRLLQRDRER